MRPATVDQRIARRARAALDRFAGALREFRKLQRELQATEAWRRTKAWKHRQARTVGTFTPPEPETPTWELEDAIDAVIVGDMNPPGDSVQYLRRRLRELSKGGHPRSIAA